MHISRIESCFVGLNKCMDVLFLKALKKKVFSGAAVGLSVGSPEKRKKLIVTYGNTSHDPASQPITEKVCFDLASLTKPLATTLAVLALIKEKKINLSETLPSLLEKELPAEKRSITLQQLLNHSAGLPAHRPYFERLVEHPVEKRKELLQSFVIKEPLISKPGDQSLYSDLGFMLLGWIIEKKSGVKLDKYVESHIFEPLGVSEGIFFKPLPAGETQKRVFAATEQCPWRNKTLAGEVSDDNTYAMGGVSGQAGLFGDIVSVLDMTTHLLDQWQGRERHPNYETADLKNFLTRQSQVKASTWALGFDTPSESGSSGGRYLSDASVGHLGFTGTSFWIDPVKDLVMVLLTNRVHPSRDNEAIKQFRPQFHDTVIEQLGLQYP